MPTEFGKVTSDTIVCWQCSTQNTNDRKFCSDCGASLWTKCPKCDAGVSVSEKFCGACGENLEAIRQQCVVEFRKTVETAETLAKEERFDEAADVLRNLLRSTGAEFKQELERLRPRIEAWESEFFKSRESIAAKQSQAEYALEQRDYEVAQSLLTSVPETWRTDPIRELLSRTRRAIAEINQLRQKVEKGVKDKKHLALLPDLDRLLQLKPDDVKFRKLAETIRDRLLLIAKKNYDDGAYEEALKAINRVRPFIANADSEKLNDAIAARCWLIRDLQRSSHVDRSLLDTAARLQKHAPDHPATKKLASEVIARAKKSHELRPPRLVRWANVPAPESPYPVLEYLPWYEAFDEAERLPVTGGYHACCFAVAVGLALQGINRAVVKTNLLEQGKTSWIRKVKVLGRKETAAAGLGMHIGSTSLKLVRLEVAGRDARPEIKEAHLFPYARSLNSVTSDFERRDLIRTALVEAKQACDLSNAPLVLSSASIAVLSRFVDLPPVDDRKLKMTIEREAKHQIPFSLDEVHWDSHVFTPTSGHARRQLMLLALKRAELKSFVEMAETLDIQVSTFQCDGVALHNLCAFLRQNSQLCETYRLAPESTLAFLHVGGDGATLVVSHPERLWFRYFAHGGARLTRMLAVEFKVAWDQAEEMKLMPVRQTHVHQIYRSLQKPLRELLQEVERSVEASRRDGGMPPASAVFLSGGATQLHGFYRAMQSGPETLAVTTVERASQSGMETFRDE